MIEQIDESIAINYKVKMRKARTLKMYDITKRCLFHAIQGSVLFVDRFEI